MARLKLRDPRGDQANKLEGFIPRVPYLVFFPSWNKKGCPGQNRDKTSIFKDLRLALMDEDLMFPGVRMTGSEAARGKFKKAHAKVPSPIIFPYQDSALYSLNGFGLELLELDLPKRNDFHLFLLTMKNF
jgi:hypothetical protein